MCREAVPSPCRAAGHRHEQRENGPGRALLIRLRRVQPVRNRDGSTPRALDERLHREDGAQPTLSARECPEQCPGGRATRSAWARQSSRSERREPTEWGPMRPQPVAGSPKPVYASAWCAKNVATDACAGATRWRTRSISAGVIGVNPFASRMFSSMKSRLGIPTTAQETGRLNA